MFVVISLKWSYSISFPHTTFSERENKRVLRLVDLVTTETDLSLQTVCTGIQDKINCGDSPFLYLKELVND